MSGTTDLDMALHSTVMERSAAIEAEQAKQDAQRRQVYYEQQEALGGAKLTKEKLKRILASDRRLYYSTPSINDKLYLHFGGYNKIENLEEFTGLKALYLESNALESLEGLDYQVELKSLFVHENCIRSLQGISHLDKLWNLNISNNFLPTLAGLPPNLNTLQAANNHLGWNGLSDVEALKGTEINVLDIQGNKIKDPTLIDEILCNMPELKVLYLKGNPFINEIKNYRKTTISKIKTLTYLDDRPVFPDDRRCAEAFVKGGLEAEREERKKIKEEERDQHRRQMENFRRMCEEAKTAGRERREMMNHDKYDENTDPVDTWEKRCKRMINGWEEKGDPSSTKRDDAKEKAEAKLKHERETKTGMYDPEFQKLYSSDEINKIPSVYKRSDAEINKSLVKGTQGNQDKDIDSYYAKCENSVGDVGDENDSSSIADASTASRGKKDDTSSVKSTSIMRGSVWDDEDIVFDTPESQSQSHTVAEMTKGMDTSKMTPEEKKMHESALKRADKMMQKMMSSGAELKNSDEIHKMLEKFAKEEEQEDAKKASSANFVDSVGAHKKSSDDKTNNSTDDKLIKGTKDTASTKSTDGFVRLQIEEDDSESDHEDDGKDAMREENLDAALGDTKPSFSFNPSRRVERPKQKEEAPPPPKAKKEEAPKAKKPFTANELDELD